MTKQSPRENPNPVQILKNGDMEKIGESRTVIIIPPTEAETTRLSSWIRHTELRTQ